eukprot:CAMPEP_0172746604 /NCGR_PEP_ID=MMETSP1074-20121228/141064_1 /TAXON_ID=2916 /ORGANISM="Ceratium fusus, Strain PA161109" /LENGTH=67 /DNA_ID=CAMNT_0013577993 /DNA_START=160 /DNA_END=359 /DNA_ORIENTATION=-
MLAEAEAHAQVEAVTEASAIAPTLVMPGGRCLGRGRNGALVCPAPQIPGFPAGGMDPKTPIQSLRDA